MSPPPGAPRRRQAQSHSVAGRLPRTRSLPVEASSDRTLGANELGRITVSDAVASRLAARAALEVDGVGAAAPRLLGKALSTPGLGRLGVRTNELGSLPASHADVDGQLAFVSLALSVRYPAPVRDVTRQVRQRVQERLRQLADLDVREVDISVPALVASVPTPPRVR